MRPKEPSCRPRYWHNPATRSVCNCCSERWITQRPLSTGRSEEYLVRNNAFVKREQQALDEMTAEVTGQLDSLKEIDEWLDLIGRLAKLAGSVATAFA